MFFKEIEGEAAIIIENGVYKQVPIFERRGELFAKSGGGFIRLMVDGSTSKAKARLDCISFDKLAMTPTGKLLRSDIGLAGTRPLPQNTAMQLLPPAVEGQ